MAFGLFNFVVLCIVAFGFWLFTYEHIRSKCVYHSQKQTNFLVINVLRFKAQLFSAVSPFFKSIDWLFCTRAPWCKNWCLVCLGGPCRFLKSPWKQIQGPILDSIYFYWLFFYRTEHCILPQYHHYSWCLELIRISSLSDYIIHPHHTIIVNWVSE